jgi:hypothetical protein
MVEIIAVAGPSQADRVFLAPNPVTKKSPPPSTRCYSTYSPRYYFLWKHLLCSRRLYHGGVRREKFVPTVFVLSSIFQNKGANKLVFSDHVASSTLQGEQVIWALHIWIPRTQYKILRDSLDAIVFQHFINNITHLKSLLNIVLIIAHLEMNFVLFISTFLLYLSYNLVERTKSQSELIDNFKGYYSIFCLHLGLRAIIIQDVGYVAIWKENTDYYLQNDFQKFSSRFQNAFQKKISPLALLS